MMGIEGILLVDKPIGKTSFNLVYMLRKILGVKKIGHAGTLDPFASGVMVMLIGRNYTKLSDRFLLSDKEYKARILLGKATDTYDCEGAVTFISEAIPSDEELARAIGKFQGDIEQIPPMFSAKKVNGKKLYDLARKGTVIERSPAKVHVEIRMTHYSYPFVDIDVKCSKGTYIRSLAHDIGEALGCGGHLISLQRTRSGCFHIDDCLDGCLLSDISAPIPSIIDRIKKDVA